MNKSVSSIKVEYFYQISKENTKSVFDKILFVKNRLFNYLALILVTVESSKLHFSYVKDR